MKKHFLIPLAIVFACRLFSPGSAAPAPAEAWKPPKSISIATLGTTSIGYITATAIYGSISKKTGVKILVEPGHTTLEQEEMIRLKQIEFAHGGGAHGYTLHTGTNEFGIKGWGPQPVRMVWQHGYFYGGFMTRGDSGIKTIPDLKGKRVVFYLGVIGMTNSMKALLAFGQLTWDDVKVIKVGGYMPGMDAVLEGSADVAYAACSAKTPMEVAASPHGIHWLPMPASDTAGWKRFRAVQGAWIPAKATYGAGISKDKPAEVMAVPYLVTCLDKQDENLCYWLTKQIAENYDAFKDKHVFNKSCTLQQALDLNGWLVPYHPGSIKYFKEIGKWTAGHEQRNAELVAEQKELRKAWEKEHPGW